MTQDTARHDPYTRCAFVHAIDTSSRTNKPSHISADQPDTIDLLREIDPAAKLKILWWTTTHGHRLAEVVAVNPSDPTLGWCLILYFNDEP